MKGLSSRSAPSRPGRVADCLRFLPALRLFGGFSASVILTSGARAGFDGNL